MKSDGHIRTIAGDVCEYVYVDDVSRRTNTGDRVPCHRTQPILYIYWIFFSLLLFSTALCTRAFFIAKRLLLLLLFSLAWPRISVSRQFTAINEMYKKNTRKIFIFW